MRFGLTVPRMLRSKDRRACHVVSQVPECAHRAYVFLYKTDDSFLTDKVKPGDQISATIYDGDYMLHSVKIAPPKN